MREKINFIFNKRDFTLLFFGQFVSTLGSGINMIGMSLYVLRFDNPILGMGVLSIIMALPWVFLSPFMGVLADKFSKKKIMIWCDILRGFLGLALFFTNNIFVFYLITLIMSSLNVIFAPAASGFLPFILDEDELSQANSLYAGSGELAFLIGPAIGGLLVSLCGSGVVFMINGISYIFSGISEMFLSVDGYIKKDEIKKISVFNEIKEGYLYATKHKGIKFIILFFGVVSLSFGVFRVLIPNYIVNQMGVSDSGYGIFVAMAGVGSTVGALAVPKLLKWFKTLELMVLGVIGYGILYFIFMFVKYIPLGLLVYFFIGFSGVFMNVCYDIYLQKHADKEYIGRVFSLDMTLTNISTLIPMIIITVLGEHINENIVLVC
ncbi:MAG: MFS transporter, partial [Sarcina sp.]